MELHLLVAQRLQLTKGKKDYTLYITLYVSRSMYRLSNSFDLSNVCYRAFQHVILFPSHKLAFCGIPKVGITQ